MATVTHQKNNQESSAPPSTGKSPGQIRSQQLRQDLMGVSNRWRERHPVLTRYQDWIGGAIMLLSVGIMALAGFAYVQGWLGAIPTVVIIAIATSFIHELEHDLIHYVYFRHRPVLHHSMMALCWLTRTGTINPWIRRYVHLLHHKVSGTAKDIEERGITNGTPWSPFRLIMIADGMMALLGRSGDALKAGRLHQLIFRGLAAYFPIGLAHYALWYLYLGFHLTQMLAPQWAATFWSASVVEVMPIVNVIAVIWIWPFFIRSFCLNFVSSNMHYFGDVEDDNIIQQTQIWTRWWLAPLYLFCFNFGATHGVHHFVVRDPFYVRQCVAKESHGLMKAAGVRFNDFGTFKRANRFTKTADQYG